VAVERGTDIQSHIESGVMIDSQLSPELIVTIFHPKTPLHDGGLIVRGDRIISAGCIFPVSQRQDLDRNLGLRHRAAIGLTEESDAIVLIVSAARPLRVDPGPARSDRPFASRMLTHLREASLLSS